jgi:DNA-binding FrmR family transcriptional regulator
MTNQKTLIWLKKARTLMDKIIKMEETGAYCIDIVQQNLAVVWLLKSANLNILEWHLKCCFVDAAKSDDKEKLTFMIGEILTIIKTAQNK